MNRTSNLQNDLNRSYNLGTIFIHWLTTLLILVLFPLGKYMEGLETSEKMGLIKIHVILGLFVFIITIIRSWLFFKKPRPVKLKTGTMINDKLADWIHNAFYFLLFGISLSGIATLSLGGYAEAITSGNIEFVKNAEAIAPLKPHGVLAIIMMILLFMHIIGVIKHYVFTKENTLTRIS